PPTRPGRTAAGCCPGSRCSPPTGPAASVPGWSTPGTVRPGCPEPGRPPARRTADDVDPERGDRYPGRWPAAPDPADRTDGLPVPAADDRALRPVHGLSDHRQLLVLVPGLERLRGGPDLGRPGQLRRGAG